MTFYRKNILIWYLYYLLVFHMTNNPNSINSTESKLNGKKSNKFVESTKKAVRKALATTWIVAGSMGPVTTPTVVPASVNTISTIAPLASTTIKTISLWTAAGLLTACGGGEDGPDWPIDTKDTIAPTINVSKSEIDITWGKQINIEWNKLYIWWELIASRSDNKTTNCNVSLSLNGKSITSWTTISEEWTLNIKVSDAAWNSKNADIKLNVTAEQESVSWLENLKNLNMQVDLEVNLLNWVSFGNWAELIKVEIELDWEKVEISDPYHYVPAYPWTCNIILTVKEKNWETKEYKVDNLTINALEYKSMEINNIEPKEILPILWQIAPWYEEDYEYINQIKIAEATRIRDMMREYGTWNHSAEEYKQLMNRLNTGMMWENPIWYNNYETVWWLATEPSSHAHDERNILNTLINHANFKIIDSWDNRWELYNLARWNKNKVNIFWISMDSNVNKEQYNARWMETHKEHLKEKNLILFWAWSNLIQRNWNLLNKIYQENYNLPDEHSTYTSLSAAHDKNDNKLDRHILITIGTNKDWDVDQSNELYNGSKFPVWFHDKVLFAWRTFPFVNTSWNVVCLWEKYQTSCPNYLNVAMIDLCFQMFAEVEDVDELLGMIRSTSLTDYIRLDWQTQKLQLINPEWFFQKYLMPADIPSNIQSSKTINLNKWYYKWIIFDVPWAEVKINWEWIAYNDTNKSKIKSQNPMNLQRRINWDLCKKLWYKWKNIEWKIVVVDDKRNGLNINKDISISVQ